MPILSAKIHATHPLREHTQLCTSLLIFYPVARSSCRKPTPPKRSYLLVVVTRKSICPARPDDISNCERSVAHFEDDCNSKRGRKTRGQNRRAASGDKIQSSFFCQKIIFFFASSPRRFASSNFLKIVLQKLTKPRTLEKTFYFFCRECMLHQHNMKSCYSMKFCYHM
jgi:hypothetical protein